jgi:hypothetical protein
MLGVTRQSAWEKWRDLDAAPAPAPEAGRPAGFDVGGDVVGEVVDRPLSDLTERRVVSVPDLIGLTWVDACQALADARLVPVAPEFGLPLARAGEPGGVVVDQTPKGGAHDEESQVAVG